MLNTKLTEEKEIQIDDEKLQGLLNEDLRKIIQGIESDGFTVRIVGGAVRDLLLGNSPRDIDLITNALPDETIFILSELNLNVDAWSISHGTIKAVIGKDKYEITSLNFQIHKKDGKLITKSHGTWEADAKRRDFTVNSMSMSLDGIIYDYANGINDLKKEIIRPLPNFIEKLDNDPVLILRFFKMIAKFEHPKYSKELLQVIKDRASSLQSIEPKRIKRELANIKKSTNGQKTLKLMKDIGIKQIITSILSKKRN